MCFLAKSPSRTRIDGFLGGLHGDTTEPSDLGRNLDRLIDNLLARSQHKSTNQANLLRLLGLDEPSGQDEVHRPGLADQVGQALGPAGAGEDTQGDFGLAESGGGGAEEDVAHHGEFASAAELRGARGVST